MKRFWNLCICLGLCLGFALPVSAYQFLRTDKNGRPYHWKRNKFPILLDLEQTGTTEIPFATVQSVLLKSVNTWNSVNCTVARLKMGKLLNKGFPAPKYDSVNVIRFINKKADWPAGDLEFAITRIFFKTDTGEILDADLLFNDWNFKWGTQGKQNEADLQATATHELGHVLGLEHTDVQGASMYARANVGETGKRNLDADDSKGLCDLYPKQECKEGTLSGNDAVCFNGRYTKICPEYYLKLCAPCNTDYDCPGAKNFCLSLSSDKKYCGIDCTSKPCASGYSCLDVKIGNKVVGKNCVPDSRNCAAAAKHACCLDASDCLPGFACQNGKCLQNQSCRQEGGACSAGGDCCQGLSCWDDGTGKKCRKPCDPLKANCSGNLRCKHLDADYSKGYCVPPNNGSKVGESCDGGKKCEYELACHSVEKKCRFICRIKTGGVCPSGFVCRAMKSNPNVGLCEAESGNQSCQSVQDCPTGRVCKNKKCSPCSDKSECGANNVCKDGFCRRECTSDNQCPRLHRCLQGACVPGKSCVNDSDCGQGLVCQRSVCTTRNSDKCESDGDCTSGQRCLKETKQCVPRTCQSDQQCGQGLACRQSTCVTKTDQCGSKKCNADQECLNNRCVSKLGAPCSGDESCASGSCIAVDKVQFCTKTCTTGGASTCPQGFNCTSLPNIGLGCWPAAQTVCEGGQCKPRFEGCGCNVGDPATGGGFVLVLMTLWFLRIRERMKKHA